MHVVEFFQPLLFPPDVHVIEAPLPDPIVSVVMNGRRQVYTASIFWHQGNFTLSRKFFRMNFAVRSSSFCRIWEGFAWSDGQSKRDGSVPASRRIQ